MKPSWLDRWCTFIGTLSPPLGSQTTAGGTATIKFDAVAPKQSASALPRNLKRLREEQGLSPTQLAAKAKVSTSTVRGMETPGDYDQGGKRSDPNPTLVSMLAVAEALEVGIGELVEEREL